MRRCVFNELYFFILTNLFLIQCYECGGNFEGNIDSDSTDYDDFYAQLKIEYEEELYKSTTETNLGQTSTHAAFVKEEENLDRSVAMGSSKEIERHESYAEATSRLQCDNPWFWNTFKCVWLDVRQKNVSPRRRKNSKVAGILIGVLSFFILLPICWFCVMATYLRSQVSKYTKLMSRYMTEYLPGSIILPNGQVKYYDPTPEEEEALEDLIHVISSVV